MSRSNSDIRHIPSSHRQNINIPDPAKKNENESVRNAADEQANGTKETREKKIKITGESLGANTSQNLQDYEPLDLSKPPDYGARSLQNLA